MDAAARGRSAVRTNEHETLLRRQAKYEALAAVFSRPGPMTPAAVPVLAVPCVPAVPCSVCMRPLSTAAALASMWCESQLDVARLTIEYRRVFVENGTRPLVSPYASAYLPESSDSVRHAVGGYYQRLDFPARGHEPADDPRHISSQLEFMAHCLERERCGLGSRVDSRLFFSDQLLPWAPMFARAAFAATTEPVLRFAALVLEQFMKCESTVLVTRKRRS